MKAIDFNEVYQNMEDMDLTIVPVSYSAATCTLEVIMSRAGSEESIAHMELRRFFEYYERIYE